MGYVRVRIQIGAEKSIAREVECLTDTGAFYMGIPPDVASELRG